MDHRLQASIFVNFQGVKGLSLPPLILEFYGTGVGVKISVLWIQYLGKLQPPVKVDHLFSFGVPRLERSLWAKDTPGGDEVLRILKQLVMDDRF